MQPTPEPTARYQCPGEANEISRSVHLGRLASFYPACRTCVCNTDTGLMSPGQLKQLGEVLAQAPVESLLFEEGLVGIDPTDINPACIRRAAAAFAHTLEQRGDLQARRGPVVIGSDGRPTPAELMAAAAEGLRMENVDVVELGPTTTGCITHAMHSLSACGGMFLGNARTIRREVSLKFWATAGVPLSRGPELEALEQQRQSNPTRTSRRSGSIARVQTEGDYLASLATGFHGLRPLRVGIDCWNGSWWRHLEILSGNVACQFRPMALRNSPENIDPSPAHDFSLWVDGDAEGCHVWDEQGHRVPGAALLCLLAIARLREQGTGTILLPAAPSAKLRKKLARHGGKIETPSAGNRAEMYAAMQQTGAILGVDLQNRFWFNTAGPVPDALQLISLLLNVLSESDTPLSERLTEIGS